jgi:AcrR family transcriptional regulator
MRNEDGAKGRGAQLPQAAADPPPHAAADRVSRAAADRVSQAEADRVSRAAADPPSPRPRRVSRQREAGEVTRRETRRRLLVAARAEFAERGYAASTVIRIADRADVSVQTLYSNWGSKRNLLRAVMESAVTGDDDVPLQPGQPPAILTTTLDPDDAKDPRRLLAHLSHEYRLMAERAAVIWQAYRDGAATDPDIAADWRQLSEIRRQAFRAMYAKMPAQALRRGLTNAAAADTAWVIASPETHDQLVRQAGYSYDQLEDWLRVTLTAALLRDPLER